MDDRKDKLMEMAIANVALLRDGPEDLTLKVAKKLEQIASESQLIGISEIDPAILKILICWEILASAMTPAPLPFKRFANFTRASALGEFEVLILRVRLEFPIDLTIDETFTRMKNFVSLSKLIVQWCLTTYANAPFMTSWAEQVREAITSCQLHLATAIVLPSTKEEFREKLKTACEAIAAPADPDFKFKAWIDESAEPKPVDLEIYDDANLNVLSPDTPILTHSSSFSSRIGFDSFIAPRRPVQPIIKEKKKQKSCSIQ